MRANVPVHDAAVASASPHAPAGQKGPASVAGPARELAMLKAALDAHAIVAITDTAGTIQYANDKFCELSGYSRAELVGANHRILNSGLHERAFFRDLWATIAAGRVWRGEIRNRAKDGRLYWVDTVIVPVIGDEGRASRYVTIRHDITARKRAEEAERDHEERRYRSLHRQLRTLWDGVPHCITVTDSGGLLLDINPAGVQLLQARDRSVLLGRDPLDWVDPDHRAAFEAVRQSTLRGTPGALQYRLRTLAGEPRWVDRRCMPLRDEEGVITGILAVTMDMSVRVEGEEALRLAKDAAEAGARSKAQFLANMSHEIRTPLNAVVGVSDLLLETPLSDTQREFVRAIQTSGTALASLINDILDLSKIEAGGMELERVEFGIVECVEDAVEVVALAASAKGLDLLLDWEGDIPERVVGDPARVRQVLVNLLGNAVKFTERGEVGLTVRREPDAAAIVLHFQVSDTGIGMPADHIPRLFQAFQQLDASTTRKFGGTGLGLAISHRLAAMMGGGIQARSQPGVGSEFTVAIPFEPPAAQPVQQPVPCSGRSVLLLDSGGRSALALQNALERLGLRVHAAGTLEQAGSHPDVDAVLLDERLAAPVHVFDRRAVVLVRPGLRAPAPEDADYAAVLHKPVRRAALRRALDHVLAPAGHAGTVAREPAVPHAGSRRLRVLLAEDNEINQMVTENMLARMGCEVAVVGDGEQAVQAVTAALRAGSPFDAVLMDVQMPVLDGLEASRRLGRECGAGAQRPWIVALTAHAMEGDRLQCLAAGMDDYVAKPITLASLQGALARVPRASAPG